MEEIPGCSLIPRPQGRALDFLCTASDLVNHDERRPAVPGPGKFHFPVAILSTERSLTDHPHCPARVHPTGHGTLW